MQLERPARRRQRAAVPYSCSLKLAECSVTAAWLAQNPEAIYGVVAENQRQRINLAKKMAEAASEQIREGSSRVAVLDDDKVSATTAEAAARNFEVRCGDLDGGHELYIHYKVLSSMVHPGADLFTST